MPTSTAIVSMVAYDAAGNKATASANAAMRTIIEFIKFVLFFKKIIFNIHKKMHRLLTNPRNDIFFNNTIFPSSSPLFLVNLV